MPLLFANPEDRFVICFLESIMTPLDARKISIFQQVSVAEQVGLSLTQSEIRRTGFLASRPKYDLFNAWLKADWQKQV